MSSPGQPDTSAAWRYPVVLAFAAAAIASSGYALHVAAEIATGFRIGTAVVSAHPRDAMLAPLSVAFACFAVMGLLPDLEIRLRPSRRSPRARRSNAVAAPLFGCALVAALATPLASPLAAAVLDRIATGHGYVACPSPNPNRFGLRQWARTLAACRSDLR
jgi:hypothetical protein